MSEKQRILLLIAYEGAALYQLLFEESFPEMEILMTKYADEAAEYLINYQQHHISLAIIDLLVPKTKEDYKIIACYSQQQIELYGRGIKEHDKTALETASAYRYFIDKALDTYFIDKALGTDKTGIMMLKDVLNILRVRSGDNKLKLSLPIIYWTGLTQDVRYGISDLHVPGTYAWLLKPVSFEIIVSTIRELLKLPA